MLLYLPTFSHAKAWDFHKDIVESLRSYLKMPENLPKIYVEDPNISKDPLIIFRTQSHDITCQAQPLLFRKSENLPWKNCHIWVLFNPLLLWVQITHLHITYFPGICQIWLQHLILSSWAWEIGPKAWFNVRSKFSTHRHEIQAQGMRVGRYMLLSLILGIPYIPGGVLPKILDRGVPPRFLNPDPI